MQQPFTETLRQIQRGTLLTELEDELAAVVNAVSESGKAGKLTLEITVKPASKGDTRQLLVDAAVKTKTPKPDAGSTIFFATEGGDLLREDPRQFKMDLREVPKEPKPLREAR